jgi:ubiquinone/menaquinone biosynthesis C-methylase UbiE
MENEHMTEKHATTLSYTNPMQHMAGNYDRITAIMMMGREKAIRKMSIDLAGIRPGDAVLEVGSGTGTLTMLAKSRSGVKGKVHGIDPLPQMVEIAKKKAAKSKMDIVFQEGTIEAIPFPEEKKMRKCFCHCP